MASTKTPRRSGHYLGLELSGAKNLKTSLAVLEYFPKEGKAFLLELYERVLPNDKASSEMHPSDEALIELIDELKPATVRMGVNVPLTLPPSFLSPKPAASASRWMRDSARRAQQHHKQLLRLGVKPLEFTTYTQRPVELHVRYEVMPRLPKSHRFEIDETLGGNKAPLTARMAYLKKHLSGVPLTEAWPKLTVSLLALDLGLDRRTVATYRNLEDGIHAREVILEKLCKSHGLFIYERDIRKLSANLACFDAFICAYTALLTDLKKCEKPPRGFPLESGWVEHPLLPPAPKGAS